MFVQIIRQRGQKKQTPGDLRAFKEGKVIYECKTLELPFKDNQPDISCIPVGIYECIKLQSSNAFNYPHFHIKNVTGRSGIKIHRLNYSRNLRGCVGVGRHHIDIDYDGLVDTTSSKDTLNELIKLLPDKFDIEIKYESRMNKFKHIVKNWRLK